MAAASDAGGALLGWVNGMKDVLDENGLTLICEGVENGFTLSNFCPGLVPKRLLPISLICVVGGLCDNGSS